MVSPLEQNTGRPGLADPLPDLLAHFPAGKAPDRRYSRRWQRPPPAAARRPSWSRPGCTPGAAGRFVVEFLQPPSTIRSITGSGLPSASACWRAPAARSASRISAGTCSGPDIAGSPAATCSASLVGTSAGTPRCGPRSRSRSSLRPSRPPALAVAVQLNQPLGGRPARHALRPSPALLAQRGVRLVHVAGGCLQRLAAVQHAGAGRLAQPLICSQR